MRNESIESNTSRQDGADYFGGLVEPEMVRGRTSEQVGERIVSSRDHKSETARSGSALYAVLATRSNSLDATLR